jgi:hypothetical protein
MNLKKSELSFSLNRFCRRLSCVFERDSGGSYGYGNGVVVVMADV